MCASDRRDYSSVTTSAQLNLEIVRKLQDISNELFFRNLELVPNVLANELREFRPSQFGIHELAGEGLGLPLCNPPESLVAVADPGELAASSIDLLRKFA